jgi:PPP family 3-phenylpropionic acid transporter
MAMVNRTGGSYGRQRLWGSLGFVVASYGLGLVVTVDSLDLIFWLQGLLLGGVLFVLAFMLPIERFGGRVNILAGLRTLGRQPSYIGFLLAMVLGGMGAAGYINFLGLHVLDLGGSGAQIGLAYAAGAVTEIPIMFMGARWFARYAHATLVTAGLGAFFLSWLIVGFAPTPAAVIGGVMLVGLGFGTFWVAAVGFASERAPAGMGATAQATLGAAQSGLGWGLGAILAGYVWDWAGGSAVLWTSAGLALAALVIFRAGLRMEGETRP